MESRRRYSWIEVIAAIFGGEAWAKIHWQRRYERKTGLEKRRMIR